ncbi:MAG: hypothetical protein MAG581_01978 [Deltaproteobacteria bacterium]|jgi:myosin heavy subunit|nr:hypothetical protein [Deltaproteobacteria bacterium]
MEPNFYVVGDNRLTAFFLRNFKFFIILLILIIIGLSVTIAYLRFINLQDLKKINVQMEQEKSRTASLIEKLKQTGQRDSKWEQQVLSQSSKQKKLNEQQASLIEKQSVEISELKSILQQREQVVQQFQREKTSTQDQINNLQLKVHSLQQQLRSTQASLSESKTENQNLNTKITEFEEEIRKFELKEKKRIQQASASAKSLKSKSVDNPAVTAEKIKINADGGNVKVSFYLTNKTKKLEIGRTGLFLSSRKNLDKDIPLRIETSIPFKIRRYRVITRTFTNVKPGTFLRIMIWNEKNQPIVDEAFPVDQ